MLEEKLYTLIEQADSLWPEGHIGYQRSQSNIQVSVRASGPIDALEKMLKLLKDN